MIKSAAATSRADQAPPKLSVIILNYNTRDRLRECLRSIRSQGRLDASAPQAESSGPDALLLEVLVVDNASGDGSAAMVAQEFPWAQLIQSPRNAGFAAGNNLALRVAKGRYLLLLNPDTVAPGGALATMVEFMDHHPQAGAAGPKLVRPSGELDLACRRSFPSPLVSLYRMLGLSRLFPRSRVFGKYNLTYLDPDQPADVDSVVGACMMVRREAMDEVGVLDETFFMYGEDLDWAFRMKQRGWKVLYNPAVRILHHKGEASRHRSYAATVEFYRSMWIFYRKHYATPALTPMVALAICASLALALFKNALRPAERKRVTT